MVFVANNPYQLAEFRLAGTDCLERGRLAMYVAPIADPTLCSGWQRSWLWAGSVRSRISN
jgi:hypothetical protein